MPRREDTAPAIVGQAYDFVLWLLSKVDNFPKAHRFTVGERLTANGLDLLTTLVEAAYSRDKVDLLQQANRKINSTRYLLRLAKDLRLMSVDSYGFSAEKRDEIGRMAGDWHKATQKARTPGAGKVRADSGVRFHFRAARPTQWPMKPGRRI